MWPSLFTFSIRSVNAFNTLFNRFLLEFRMYPQILKSKEREKNEKKMLDSEFVSPMLLLSHCHYLNGFSLFGLVIWYLEFGFFIVLSVLSMLLLIWWLKGVGNMLAYGTIFFYCYIIFDKISFSFGRSSPIKRKEWMNECAFKLTNDMSKLRFWPWSQS